MESYQEKVIAEELFFANWPSWLRWVLVLPSSVIGALLVSTLVNILNGALSDNSLVTFWSQLISSVVLGLVFVYFAAAVAPSHQFEVAIVFLVVLSVLFGMLWVLGLVRNVYGSGWGIAFYSLHDILSLLGGVGGLITVKENHKKSS